jgi:peptidyl-tRNA hydrolase
MYAVVRQDLNMSAGKIASQCGHAYLDSYLQSPDENYLNSPTKICLGANERELVKVCNKCDELGIDYVKVIDPDFEISGNEVVRNEGGEPAFTAVGIGPILKDEVRKVVSNLKLL